MTIAEAKEIIRTQTLPMTKDQRAKYMRALQVVSGHPLKAPTEG